ncbi:low temperature requirement protein A [Agromyces protaetiae]|uniref:Low temperature requirement protein A n=2 Tax=Agromyces protaetiae TaxID=2509455 RepID=A0A4P6FI29_9MICO|nr:low temperature requirement protein A [Agromyces protaetiae]
MFEIFFDLVFVFALMRVVELMEQQPGPAGLARGAVVLLLLWWAWCAYIWLGNRVRLDRGGVVATILVSMGALFVAALVIPSAWEQGAGAGPRSPSSALVLAIAFIVVRSSYVATFIRAARDDRRLRTQVLIDLIPQTAGSVLLIVGALLGGDLQVVCWAAAFALDFGVGWLASRYNGWRVTSPAHFVERHGLVLIIALGETVLSSGGALGAAMADTSARVLAVPAALLAFVIVVGLWWAYFRGPSTAAADALVAAPPRLRPALARDGYTLGHLPLLVGIVYVALGVRLLLEDVVVTPFAPASPVAVAVLAGGLACYLFGLDLFARLMTGAWSGPGTITAGAAAIVVGGASVMLPAFAALAAFATLVAIAASATSMTRITSAGTSGRRR